VTTSHVSGTANHGRSHQVGTLEAVKLADIVILDGNPLDGFWNLLNTKLVIKSVHHRFRSAIA
jgi:imidazolonepropionase-like amidohydrolase